MIYKQKKFNLKKHFTCKREFFKKFILIFILFFTFSLGARPDTRDDLVAEVYTYMSSRHSGCEIGTAKHIVDKCLDENFDICFLLSQGEIETCFGKVGIGKKTSRKSIFGVYRTYESYTQCINDYIRLIKEKYLFGERTIFHLMKNFVTRSGARYAGSRGYESKIKNNYYKICKVTNIKSLQDKCKKES